VLFFEGDRRGRVVSSQSVSAYGFASAVRIFRFRSGHNAPALVRTMCRCRSEMSAENRRKRAKTLVFGVSLNRIGKLARSNLDRAFRSIVAVRSDPLLHGSDNVGLLLVRQLTVKMFEAKIDQ
jgi:hypothetical protein